MFETVIRSIIFSVCFLISLSLILYMDLIFAQGNEWGDTEGWYMIAPFLIVNGIYGVLTNRFRDIILYSFIGAFLIMTITYLETLFDSTQDFIEPDLWEFVYHSHILYALAMFGISFIVSFFPLICGWSLGAIKRKVLN